MIGVILDILEMNEWYDLSEDIEIAKGKNELCLKVKDAYKQQLRKQKWSGRR